MMSVYRFGDFVLDVNAHQLRRGNDEIPVEPKAFSTLLYLVERQGRLVRKRELIEALWTDVFVTEGALVRCIVEVRKALDDDPASPHFVQTITRVGYKFIAEVTKAVDGGVRDKNASSPLRIRSLAVMPFINLNADPGHDYFVDGIADLLITDLGKIRALRVTSRTSTMRYKRTTKSVPQIGRELNVDAVVEGAVLRIGERVRITAQLVDAPTDRHLWAESYERDLQDILKLQSDVARDIAAAVQITLTPQETLSLSSNHSVSLEAHEAYLKACYFWHQRTEEGIRKSMEYFHQAASNDPACARAYAGLADCYGVAGFFGHIPPADAFPKMLDSAARALDLDAGLPEAHAALGAAHLFYSWEWSAAERALNMALDLNPNYSVAHEWYGWYMAVVGRLDETVRRMERTRVIDPLSLRSYAALGMSLYFARRHDEAVERLRMGVEMDPNFPELHCTLGLNFQQMGMLEHAIDEFQRALDLSGRSIEDLASLGSVYAMANRKDQARDILAELNAMSKRRYVSPVYPAAIYAGLDERDDAFVLLEKALLERAGWLVFLKVEPWWDNLRQDSRFDNLARRVGL